MSGKRKYSNVIKAVYDRPWAILPSMLAVIEEVVQLRAGGAALSDEEIEARINAAANGPRQGARGGSVAVIPIYGVLTKRAGLMSAMSGATSLDALTADFRGAMADPEVGAIVFDVDSPGGSVDGIEELATEIRGARGRKPMVAVANTMAASAAYWLAAQADELVVTPSGEVGSIGIYAAHQDVSAAEEKVGIKTTLISAGKFKTEGNEHEPLSADAKANIQAQVDDFYAMFITSVAKGRSSSVDTVRKGYGQGRTMLARKALDAGMADRIDTLEATVARYSRMVQRSSSVAAFAAVDEPGVVASALLAQMSGHEQVAWLTAERDRVLEMYAKKSELRAKEGRALPESTEQQLAALSMDLDTDQPEEAAHTRKGWRTRTQLALSEAAFVSGYHLSE